MERAPIGEAASAGTVLITTSCREAVRDDRPLADYGLDAQPGAKVSELGRSLLASRSHLNPRHSVRTQGPPPTIARWHQPQCTVAEQFAARSARVEDGFDSGDVGVEAPSRDPHRTRRC